MTYAASVALLTTAIDKPLSYLVPESLAGKIARGVVVAGAAAKAAGVGCGAGGGQGAGRNASLKRIQAMLDDKPALTEAQMQLARWISAEYFAPLGRCCALMVPPGFTARSAYVYALADDGKASNVKRQASEVTQKLYAVLQTRGPITESKLKLAMKGVDGWKRVLGAWVRVGAVTKASTLQPPKVQPQRTTLAQLAVGESTLALVLANLDENRKLQPHTRARRASALTYLQTHNGIAWADWISAETGATRADLSWLADQDYMLLGDADALARPAGRYGLHRQDRAAADRRPAAGVGRSEIENWK